MTTNSKTKKSTEISKKTTTSKPVAAKVAPNKSVSSASKTSSTAKASAPKNTSPSKSITTTAHSSSTHAKSDKKPITVALQGGGSYGAFTWGVLDRLLEDGRFEIQGVTGTSAGAMNAAALLQGLMKNGQEGAREELKRFWMKLNYVTRYSPINQRGFWDRMFGHFTMYQSPGYQMISHMSALLSPYEFNPMDINPLRDLVNEFFDFDLLRKSKDCQAFVCATHVKTGKLRVFKTQDLDADVLLASACLPTLYRPVKVKGEYYWDGGFIGNPVFFPLINECETPDIVLIQVNKSEVNTIPYKAQEISDRLNEIVNNASVIREMRAISLISDLIDNGVIKEGKMKRVYMHVIESTDTFKELGWSAKLNTEKEFLEYLFEEGRQAAELWIKKNYDSIGKKTTALLQQHYVD